MAASPTMRSSTNGTTSRSPKSLFVPSNASNTVLPPPSPIPFATSSLLHPFTLSQPSSSYSSCSSSSTASSPTSRCSSPKPPDRYRLSSHSPKPTQFIMLHNDERSPSPLTLTSSLAPPSMIPLSAAGISIKPPSKKSSRNSPAAHLKLSMLPTFSQPLQNSAVNQSFSMHHSHNLSAQQQLQMHQKEIISQATRATGIPQHLLSTGPMSPRLIPLGSPGPVTPLTLEENPGGYLFAGGDSGYLLEQQQLQQQLAIVAAGQGEIRRGY
ncbi:hypothetical protein RUND412_008322 [Rhizina undulata]